MYPHSKGVHTHSACDGNNVVVSSYKVSLGPGVAKAVVLGNIITGTERIINNGAKNVQKGYNAADA